MRRNENDRHGGFRDPFLEITAVLRGKGKSKKLLSPSDRIRGGSCLNNHDFRCDSLLRFLSIRCDVVNLLLPC